MDPARMLAGFPAPWSVTEATGEFIVKDASDRALAYFYWWGTERRPFSHGTRRDAWRRNLRGCHVSWRNGSRGDNVTPPSQP
jgi:hypothetical protein